MRIFEVRPGHTKQGGSLINASHKWGLPGVACNSCGQTWGNVGIAYPSVDLTSLPFEKRYRDLRPVSLDELNELRRMVAPLLPDGAPLPPGTSFGALTGTATGTFDDVAWLNPWTMLVQSDVLIRLQRAAVHTPVAIRPELMFSGRKVPDLLELELEPCAKIPKEAPQSDDKPCRRCGYVALNKPVRIAVELSSLPQKVDLFRGRDYTTLIFATERLVEAAQHLNLTNIKFNEVDVST